MEASWLLRLSRILAGLGTATKASMTADNTIPVHCDLYENRSSKLPGSGPERNDVINQHEDQLFEQLHHKSIPPRRIGEDKTTDVGLIEIPSSGLAFFRIATRRL